MFLPFYSSQIIALILISSSDSSTFSSTSWSHFIFSPSTFVYSSFLSLAPFLIFSPFSLTFWIPYLRVDLPHLKSIPSHQSTAARHPLYHSDELTYDLGWRPECQLPDIYECQSKQMKYKWGWRFPKISRRKEEDEFVEKEKGTV